MNSRCFPDREDKQFTSRRRIFMSTHIVKSLASAILGIFIVFGAPAHATVIATSTFDSDADGWTWDPINDPPFSWQSAGGNPGGYIQFDDSVHTNQVGAFIHAPAKFLGDWLSLGVSELSYDSNIFRIGAINIVGRHVVNLSGPGGDATWLGPAPDPATPWKLITVPVDEASWTVNTGSWNAILSNVSDLSLFMELYNNTMPPGDLTGVDNISLNAVPEPSSAVLIGSSLLGILCMVAKRRIRNSG